jgi:3-oxoacyl-[acyl-carrier protein] reductase
VTGGSRRIGKAIALALARAGADVAITYRERTSIGRSVAKSIEGLGRTSIAIRADLSRPADCRTAVDRAARALGGLDILVNNVGPWIVRNVSETSLAAWRSVLDSNLTATFLCSQRAIRYMQRRGGGRIINLGAAGSYRAHGSARLSAYYAAKAGIVAFSKALAREVGKDSITVNVVSPGVIGAGRSVRTDGSTNAVGRLGKPEDVAAVVVFLASDEASYVTGDVIGVSGGWLL